MKIKFPLNLIWQPLIVVIFVAAVLVIMNHIAFSDLLWAVGASSLASSACLVLIKPSANAARSRNVIAGYVISIIIGLIIWSLAMLFFGSDGKLLGTSPYHIPSLTAALAVGVTVITMSLLKLEHPPAAGFVIVLVLDIHDYDTVLLVITAAIFLALARRILSKYLIDLV